mgnify:CR=1 FL=1
MISRLLQVLVLFLVGCTTATVPTHVGVPLVDELRYLSPRCQTHLVVPEGVDYHTMVVHLRPGHVGLFRVGVSSTHFGSAGAHRVCYHYAERGQQEVALYFVTERPIRAFAINSIEVAPPDRMTVRPTQLVYPISCEVDGERRGFQTFCSDGPSSLGAGPACEYWPDQR